MSRSITFTVDGDPKPAGSKNGYVNPKTGGVIITDASGKPGKEWRKLVKKAAEEATDAPLTGPLLVTMVFYRERPKSHYGTGKNLHVRKGSAPILPTTRPDVLKLARAVEDAMTGVVYEDDAQVCDERLLKVYGTPGVRVSVFEMESIGIPYLEAVRTTHPAAGHSMLGEGRS